MPLGHVTNRRTRTDRGATLRLWRPVPAPEKRSATCCRPLCSLDPRLLRSRDAIVPRGPAEHRNQVGRAVQTADAAEEFAPTDSEATHRRDAGMRCFELGLWTR